MNNQKKKHVLVDEKEEPYFHNVATKTNKSSKSAKIPSLIKRLRSHPHLGRVSSKDEKRVCSCETR